jgi:plasmid maintenance system antidote protein VapI
MSLDAYLKKNRISKAEAARQIGISNRHIFNAVNNKAGKKTALKIQSWSGGRVSAIELMGMK